MGSGSACTERMATSRSCPSASHYRARPSPPPGSACPRSHRVVRVTTASLHTGVKEHYAIGRIDRGDTEWWSGGKVWRSVSGCILVKQPGDVVRHLAHRGPTTFTAVMLPMADVAHVRSEGRAVTIP